MKKNIRMIKGFRIYFAIGIMITILGAIISDAPIYVPFGLLFVGGFMVWFIGMRINSLKEEENGK